MPAALPLTTDAPAAALADGGAGLKAWLAARGEPGHRFGQIRRWILANRAESFDAMTDLPKSLRPELAENFSVFGTRVARHLVSADDTHKLVLALADGRHIESVLIQDDGRATACISTQVGCGMGCVFCASGINGVVRNLSIAELVEQLVRLRNITDPRGTRTDRANRLTHIVVMGMGEPLANLENLLAALAIAGEPDSLGIGARHVTISTVGLPAKMRQLAESGKQYHLAVSLHAPNDELRSRIVPMNEKIGLADILAAADDFQTRTGRQVTYEYVVLGGVNDRPEHARQLAALLRGRGAFVNLIPWNAVSGLPFQSPQKADVANLIDALKRAGVSAKVRRRKGADIDAACGQLRREVEQP